MKRLLLLSALIPALCFGQAKWITAVESQSATGEWLCFRSDFKLDAKPAEAVARIAVDSKYWLWINNQPVLLEGGVKRGPNPQDTYCDAVDLAPWLKEGGNTVAILVWHFGKEGFSHNPSGKAGLLFDCPAVKISSNGSWKAMVHPAFFIPAQPWPNFRLSESSIGFDANYDVEGWMAGELKGKPWHPAREIGTEGSAPWGKLHDRVIPQFKNFGLREYVSTELKPGEKLDTLVCTMPYNLHANPWLKVDAKGGERIVMLTDHYTGGGPYNLRAEYIAKPGIQEYESLGWINGHKMYYLLPKGLKPEKVMYRETGYDTEFTGKFQCSDEFFNRLNQKAVRTLYVTMRDTYMDCPDRERAQWWGDEVNESGEAFYALDPKSHLLMKKGMYELIGWQRPDGSIYSPVPSSNYNSELPGQMLASVGYYGFWNYYLNTGDRKPIEDLYDGVRRYLKAWTIEADGTVAFRQGGWTWGDWGINVDKPALFNAWYSLALKGARNMAEVIGREADVQEYAAAMERLKEGFNRKFWNGKAYRSPDYTGDTDDRVQALAVVAGMVPEKLYPAIFEVIKTQEYASPYMEKYVTEALFMIGQGKYGLERHKRRFAEQVDDPDCTTLYEGWGVGAKGFGGGTMNHAWSGGGLTLLYQYVCGISPVEPGFKRFQVMPDPAGLKQASAQFVSVAGEIAASFADNGKTFTLEVSVPEGTVADIGIPAAGVKEVLYKGRAIWKRGRFAPAEGLKPGATNAKYIKFVAGEGDWKLEARK